MGTPATKAYWLNPGPGTPPACGQRYKSSAKPQELGTEPISLGGSTSFLLQWPARVSLAHGFAVEPLPPPSSGVTWLSTSIASFLVPRTAIAEKKVGKATKLSASCRYKLPRIGNATECQPRHLVQAHSDKSRDQSRLMKRGVLILGQYSFRTRHTGPNNTFGVTK